jgi:hypothetical protein
MIMIEGAIRRVTRIASRAGGVLVVLASMALPAYAQEAGIRVITMTIASSGAHKECVSLSKAQSLHYWFRSDAPIDFNIQYQDGSGLVFPVKREKLSMGTGTFPAKAAEVHCMVLTNRSQKPVTVRFEFARLER